jgi:two-component system KDP operon response regulator KdpE
MVLTHTQILREIWGPEMLHKVSYLRVYLLALRRKLENPAEPELLLTERSVGYRLVFREE